MKKRVTINTCKGKMCDQACCINCKWYYEPNPSKYYDAWMVNCGCWIHEGTFRGDDCCSDWSQYYG